MGLYIASGCVDNTVVALLSLLTCHLNQAEIEESKKPSVTRIKTRFPGMSL